MTTMTIKQTPDDGQALPDQAQVTIIIETLEELSAHPDFQAGLRDVQTFFLESHEAAPLTENEMMDEVETNLCRSVVEHSRTVISSFGEFPPSYLYSLRFVFGTINEGLTYAYQVYN